MTDWAQLSIVTMVLCRGEYNGDNGGDDLEDDVEGLLVKYDFGDEGSEAQTASDMRDIESKHHMSLPDMKMQLIGSVSFSFVGTLNEILTPYH